jgi:hypothetical protein
MLVMLTDEVETVKRDHGVDVGGHGCGIGPTEVAEVATVRA